MLRTELQGGADFAELARRHSDDGTAQGAGTSAMSNAGAP